VVKYYQGVFAFIEVKMNDLMEVLQRKEELHPDLSPAMNAMLNWHVLGC
jgi:hypothetical protein